MIKKENLTTSAFYERFNSLTDDRIMDILHNQKDYQEAACNAAAQIAVERGLIHSTEDLVAPEYQNARSSKQTAFPSISDAYQYNRMRASIFRFLLVFSALPFIYGVIQYAKGEAALAILGVAFSVVWFLLVLAMKRTQKSVLVYPLLALVLAAGVIAGMKIAVANPVKFMDAVILIVGISLPSYFLLYARKLVEHK